jgi:hypothetical protein
MDEMDLKSQAQLLCALLPYIIPRKASVETSKAIEIPKEFNALTYEQLDQIQNIIEGKQPAYQITNGESSDRPF